MRTIRRRLRSKSCQKATQFMRRRHDFALSFILIQLNGSLFSKSVDLVADKSFLTSPKYQILKEIGGKYERKLVESSISCRYVCIFIAEKLLNFKLSNFTTSCQNCRKIHFFINFIEILRPWHKRAFRVLKKFSLFFHFHFC